MPFAWKPVPGQVALIELSNGGNDCLTGVVVDGLGGPNGAVVIDLGASPRPDLVGGDGGCEVVASFFAPDALYRITATAAPHDGAGDAVIDLRVHAVERVQRRQTPRARHHLHAVLSNFDDPGALVSVVGTTVDIGQGGCRIRTAKPFPPGCDPTVSLALDDGSDIVLLGAVLQVTNVDDGYEYRIVFLDVEDEDRSRLAQLVTEPAAA